MMGSNISSKKLWEGNTASKGEIKDIIKAIKEKEQNIKKIYK